MKSCTVCFGIRNPVKVCFRCNDEGVVADGWEEPADPPFDLIHQTAYNVGYAVAVHGSRVRDFDIIAVPWTAEAGGCRKLLEVLCKALNAKIVDRSSKPHGRNAFNLQMDGYIKLIDISILPTLRDTPAFPHHFKRTNRDGD
jgi:hypothetical protein